MELEWLLAAIVIAAATPAFGHFETVRPVWARIARWLAYLAITGILGATVGRPWTLMWVLGLPVAGAAFHFAWCHNHGINPITAEPRDRYEQLRKQKRTTTSSAYRTDSADPANPGNQGNLANRGNPAKRGDR